MRADELVEAEGLGEIVVGAGVEQLDLLAFLAARGEHEDRRRAPLAQRERDLATVHVRQAEIEQHDVGRVLRGEEQRLRSRRRLDPAETRGGQARAQEAPHLGLVLDDQHQRSGGRAALRRRSRSAAARPRARARRAAGRRGRARRRRGGSRRRSSRDARARSLRRR
jgi:hypothetical protein